MSILSDAAMEELNEKTNDTLMSDIETGAPDPEEVKQNFNSLKFDFSFLKTPTGSGSIDEYLDHVLNVNHSRGAAQMLRGFTGFAGNLNLAIIDIIFGAFSLLKENKKPAAAAAAQNEVAINEKPIINFK